MKRCPTCGHEIRSRRSQEISTRFHGHVTWMTRALYEQYTRDEVYMFVLLKACEIEPPAGGAAYPYRVIRELVWIQEERVEADVLVPLRTTNRSNKEMMTACFAAELLAAEWDIGPLPETYDENGVTV